jgi:hypothetical protein
MEFLGKPPGSGVGPVHAGHDAGATTPTDNTRRQLYLTALAGTAETPVLKGLKRAHRLEQADENQPARWI